MGIRFHLAKRSRSRVVKLRKLGRFIREVVNEFLNDNCLHLAASISYYLLFSIPPLTLAFISVLGFVMRSPELEARVIEGISDFIPVSGDFIPSSIRSVINARGTAGVIATIGLLWAGSSLFNAIRKSLNTAWGIKKPRPFMVEKLMEIGMMAGLGLLLLISVSATTMISVVQRYSLTIAGSTFLSGAVFLQAIFVLLTIALSFATFLLLYKFIPNTRVRWSDVWGGALLAAVAFEAVKQIFVWYATNFAHYNLIYGPVGTVIALLIWTYFSAVIVLFCAKLTSVYSRQRLSFFEDVVGKGKARIKNGIQSFMPLL